MFSGIIKEAGTISNLEFKSGLLEISVFFNKLNNVQAGDSIAINGCCLTVTKTSQSSFIVQATEETLQKTNLKYLEINSTVNLEPSLELGDKLNGHLVLGHIDAVGKISSVAKNDENIIVNICYPHELIGFIAPKGSISVNGVSLTVIESKDSIFNFTLIPYTRDNTNLGLLKIGDAVNLEIDVLSRYLINYLESRKVEVKG